MAAHESTTRKKGPQTTTERGLPGAFEGETVTRRRFMEANALALGGIATAAFGLPALGFALGPVFRDTETDHFQDVGPEADFDEGVYVTKVITLEPEVGEAGKTTIYVRKAAPGDKPVRDPKNRRELPFPYVAISTRCTHLGCPVRFVQASARFICPCHGGVYGASGEVVGGPPVRPLDRFMTKVVKGRVLVGPRFSVNSQLEFYSPRDPSNHLDGLWKYLYPGRFTT
jgi:menaquinol-cytochrome c reductase iron-sulfur subunit